MMMPLLVGGASILVLIYAFYAYRKEMGYERAVWISAIIIAWELVLLSSVYR
jgi:hypothetical protein